LFEIPLVDSLTLTIILSLFKFLHQYHFSKLSSTHFLLLSIFLFIVYTVNLPVIRPRSCRVIYYFDTPALGRRHQSFGRVSNPHGFIEMLSWASHHMLIIKGLVGVGEQHHHFCFYQWRLDMCYLISPSLHICPHRLVVFLLHGHQDGSVRSNFQIEFILLQKDVYQILLLINFGTIQSHIPVQGRLCKTILKEID
jgi:hypothetical protein